MAAFRYLRAQYYDEDPARAQALRRFHLSEQEAAGLLATETSHPPNFSIPNHSHDLHSFYLVLAGSLTELDGRTEAAFDSRHLIFTPAGHVHRNVFHARGGRCFLVELSPAWNDRLAMVSSALPGPVVQEAPELSRLGLLLYHEFRAPDSVSFLAAEGLVLELLAGFARRVDSERNAYPSWLTQIRDLLHDRFADRLILAQLATEVGVHPVHLSRTFRKRYRCTPGEYQRRLKLEHASRLLATTRQSLAEIALAAGFADQAHFSRVFKHRTGWTPARFRETFSRR